MRKVTRILCLMATTLISLYATEARATFIPSSFDYIVTPPGGTHITNPLLNGGTPVSLFSNPWVNPSAKVLWGSPPPPTPFPTKVFFQTQWVDPHGKVVSADDIHKVKQVTNAVEIANEHFDTVVHRLNGVTMGGVGSSPKDVQLQTVWLSLMNTTGTTVDGLAGLWDIYLGIDPLLTQTGYMQLTSTSADGRHGDIHLGNGLPDGPNGELPGLPVNWFLKAFPHGTLIAEDLCKTGAGPVCVQGFTLFENKGPATFSLVPIPAASYLFLPALVGLFGVAHRKGYSASLSV